MRPTRVRITPAASGVLEEGPTELFEAVGAAAFEKGAEAQQEEIDKLKEGLKAKPAAPPRPARADPTRDGAAASKRTA